MNTPNRLLVRQGAWPPLQAEKEERTKTDQRSLEVWRVTWGAKSRWGCENFEERQEDPQEDAQSQQWKRVEAKVVGKRVCPGQVGAASIVRKKAEPPLVVLVSQPTCS